MCSWYATLIPHLRRRPGAIVNVASSIGLIGAAQFTSYALSKAAIVSLTQSLALELAPDHVRVNAVCPGATSTPMLDVLLAESHNPEAALKGLISLHPLGRVSTPLEQAQGALYLASDEASYVTGHALVIDGGRVTA